MLLMTQKYLSVVCLLAKRWKREKQRLTEEKLLNFLFATMNSLMDKKKSAHICMILNDTHLAESEN